MAGAVFSWCCGSLDRRLELFVIVAALKVFPSLWGGALDAWNLESDSWGFPACYITYSYTLCRWVMIFICLSVHKHYVYWLRQYVMSESKAVIYSN